MIDWKSQPDRDWKWIGHCLDHCGSIHVLWAQKTKTAVETKQCFKERWLGYFGLPQIIQSDNGKSFNIIINFYIL